nr:tetratricopeptide repeat protein [Rhodospirillales bacterium]
MKKLLFLSIGCILILTGCSVNHLGEGLTAGRNRDYTAMRKHCLKASQQPNSDPLAFKCLGEAQLNLGQRQMAEESFLTYLARIPNDLEVRFAIINLYFSMGRYSAAQGHLETILNIQPGHVEALFRLGESHRLTNNCDGALLAYDKALQINPGYGDAFVAKTKAEKEICEIEENKVVIKPSPKPKPKVTTHKKFQAGGAAIDESDW